MRQFSLFLVVAMVLLGLLSPVRALTDYTLVVVNNQLEWYAGGSYYPTRFNGGDTEYLYNGTWYTTGVSATQGQSILTAGTTPTTPPPSTGPTPAQVATEAQKAEALQRERQNLVASMQALSNNHSHGGGSSGSGGGSSGGGGSSSTQDPADMRVLADEIAVPGGWRLALGASSDYYHTSFTGGGNTGTWREELDGTLSQGRWRVVLGVPYEYVTASSAARYAAHQTVGLQVTPVYRLLDESTSGIDASILTTLGVDYAWYNQHVSGVSSSLTTLNSGLGLGIGRTTPIGYFNLGYMYQPTWSLDSSKEANNKTRQDIHGFGAGYSVPLARDVVAYVNGVYSYAPGLAAGWDRSQIDGTVGVSYVQPGWALGAHAGKVFRNANYDQWSAGLDLTFKW